MEHSIRENCGLFAVYGKDNAAVPIYHGLFSLQHRGQESAGIVTADGDEVFSKKGQGLVGEVFSPSSLKALRGHLGVGHVRYSTTGSSRAQNVQPLVVECVDGIWAVAHNGNIVNALQLRRMYQDAGAIFQTGTDSEVLVHLLADPMYRSRPGRVCRALSELRGAFSFVILTRSSVMAARDVHGFKPLCMGNMGKAVVFASESCALSQVGADYVRDIEPGELVVADKDGLKSSRFGESDSLSHCVFEMVYFARPDSLVFGRNVHETRLEYGIQLAREHPADADIVFPVPDSGNSAALGYSRESGIPLDSGFIRNHYVGRTFIMPAENEREAGVDMKLAVLTEAVRGKRVVVVDDSIVRGTTMCRRVAALRDAGAREIHLRVSCPPVKHPCFYGIDFPTSSELAAQERNVDEIRQFVGADSLGYLSQEGLLSPFRTPGRFCTACFTGEYATPTGAVGSKDALEKNICR
ncbi:MAG: amidophosphoribosyltransferase [Kiritimatiellia bacterium]